MTTHIERRVNDMELNYGFTHLESEEIVGLIMELEGLTDEQAKYYDFVEAYENHGSAWSSIGVLVAYVNNNRFMTNRETMKAILDTSTLHPVTSGVWIGWKY